jgi:hypothetical protein
MRIKLITFVLFLVGFGTQSYAMKKEINRCSGESRDSWECPQAHQIDANTEQKEIMPGRNAVNEEVTDAIKRRMESLCLCALGFALDELMKLLDEEPTFRTVWQEKVIRYPALFTEEVFYLSENECVTFFFSTLESRSDLRDQYPDEFGFLKQHVFPRAGKSLTRDDYAWFAKLYEQTSDFFDMSAMNFNLLITDGVSFVEEVEKDEDAKRVFRKWIGDIEKTEFSTYFLPLAIIERRREYILEKYESCDNALMKEVLKKIREAQVDILN